MLDVEDIFETYFTPLSKNVKNVRYIFRENPENLLTIDHRHARERISSILIFFLFIQS